MPAWQNHLRQDWHNTVRAYHKILMVAYLWDSNHHAIRTVMLFDLRNAAHKWRFMDHILQDPNNLIVVLIFSSVLSIFNVPSFFDTCNAMAYVFIQLTVFLESLTELVELSSLTLLKRQITLMEYIPLSMQCNTLTTAILRAADVSLSPAPWHPLACSFNMLLTTFQMYKPPLSVHQI